MLDTAAPNAGRRTFKHMTEFPLQARSLAVLRAELPSIPITRRGTWSFLDVATPSSNKALQPTATARRLHGSGCDFIFDVLHCVVIGATE
jgi:hypothetical protein